MTAVNVDHKAGAAGVSIGVKVCAGHTFTHVDVDDPHPMASSFGLLRGEPHGGRFGVAEEYLRYGMCVGGGDVRAPRSAVERLTCCRCGDGSAGDARLILALMGQQCPVVYVAEGVEPVVVSTRDA